MRKYFGVILLMFSSILTAQELQTDYLTLKIGKSQVYMSMVHTPNWHVLQTAPYSVPYYTHLNIGSGPISVKYALVDDVKDFYNSDFNNVISERSGDGTVSQNALISATINISSNSQLYNIPSDITVEPGSVKFAVAVFYGSLNIPAFSDQKSTFFWLRPIINKPIKGVDGKYLYAFSKLELGLFTYFSEDCVLNGNHINGPITYIYNQVAVKKGWNLLAVMWGDGSNTFNGKRYIVNIDKSTEVNQLFIPYW